MKVKLNPKLIERKIKLNKINWKFQNELINWKFLNLEELIIEIFKFPYLRKSLRKFVYFVKFLNFFKNFI